MTEEQQAELLAAWLADPEAPIPDGLDADVVETVLALHPERAPAPRVTADSILDLVETGPLAPTVVEPPVVPEPANRGWWKWALAGSSTLAVAALALVVVGVGVVGTQATPQREASMDAMSEEGVAAAPELAADTGRKGIRMARRAGPIASHQPAAAATQRAPAEKPIAELALPEAEPADAVAFAEDADGDDFVDGVEAQASSDDLDAAASAGPGVEGRGGYASTPARAATRGQIQTQAPTETSVDTLHDLEAEKPSLLSDEPDRDAELQRRRLEEEDRYDDARQAEARARMGAEESEHRPEESERKAEEQRARREAESAQRAAETAVAQAKEEARVQAGAAKAERTAKKSRAPRPRPRPAQAPSADAMESIPEAVAAPEASQAPAAPPPPPSDPDLRAARDFLVVGDPASALNAIARGLTRNRADSRIRQQLFQVRGDAYTALGQAESAAEAYREAQAIGARL